MTNLSGREVEERLRKAAVLRRQLDDGRPGSSLDIETEWNDQDLRQAAEALSWLRWLDRDDASLVLCRLEGARWKAICWRFAVSRPSAHRRWRYSIRLIAWRLNGNDAPRNVSRRRLAHQFSAAGL